MLKHLLLNRSEMIEDLQVFIDMRNDLIKYEDPVFHEEIKEQFIFDVKQYLGKKLSQYTSRNPEEILLFLEDFNVDLFIYGIEEFFN